jgi:hypothetical protein
LNSFIIVKDNKLNAIDKLVQTITITDFYRYSIAILNYIKSSKADSIALSAIKSQSTKSGSSNISNSNKRRTNKPLKGISIEAYIKKWLSHKLEKSDTRCYLYYRKPSYRVKSYFYLYLEKRSENWKPLLNI